MTIREPFNDTYNRLWCGPAAISAITGAPISKIIRLTQKYRKDRGNENYKKAVSGMWDHEILAVLKKLEKKPNTRRFPEHLRLKMVNRTVKSFIHDVGHMGPFMILTTDHALVIDKGMICDSTCQIPAPFSEYTKYDRCRVESFWYFGK